MSIEVTNAGPDAATLHVLPTAWFRNTWSWELGTPRPLLSAAGDGTVSIQHPFGGELQLLAGAGPDGAAPVPLFCENETNVARLFGAAPVYPTGSGRRLTFGEVASDLRDRLISLFAAGPDGRRPCFGGLPGCRTTPSGGTTSCSASTSTATTEPVSAPRTRPAGPA
ncbi:MAG: hypothetical protein WA895_10770 [Streptosporangiaceae bacterium]